MEKRTFVIEADPKAMTFEMNKNGKAVAKVAMQEITVGSYTYKAYTSVYRVNAAEAVKAKPQAVAVTKADDRLNAMEAQISTMASLMEKLVALQMAPVEPKAKRQAVRQ